MKLAKITTEAFPVSDANEKRLIGKLKNNLPAKILGQKTTIEKGYLPLASYRMTRQEQDKKEFKITENCFYVDLAGGEIYFLSGKKIIKYDLLQRIIDLPLETISLLGELMRDGSRPRDELDPAAVDGLWARRLIHIFRDKKKVMAALLLDELSADPTGRKTQTKEHVKTIYPLPGFRDAGFNLQNHLLSVRELAPDYEREGIRYPTDTVGNALASLFKAEAELVGITYMPYLKAKMRGKVLRESGIEHPLSFRRGEKTRRGEKIRQIALATDIGSEGAIPTPSETLDFSDVCGMTEVKKEITNLLIKPLKDPRHAKKIKKKIGGTMLLYGPPGCGKTYVARAAVGETGLPFFNVNLSDISRLGASDGAKALHEVFSEAAKNAPAIVFFDEIDSIGGVRKEGQKEKERLGVTQLLVELDGAESLTEKVLVIGATNMPWALDPALRRAGRFTRQIYVGPPEEKTRRELFRKHLKDTPKKKIDYTALAEKTEKYSAADISAICELAGQKLWEKDALEEEDLKSALEKHTSSLSAWYKLAEKELRKSGEETFYQEMTGNILSEAGGLDEERDIQVRFQDVGGMEDVKQEIRKSIIYPLEKPELAQRYGKRSGGAILFYGPPGCGKTYMAKATAGECNAAFYNVELSNLCGDDAEKKIAEVFERAKRNTPAVLFFDEIEALAGRREKAVGPEKKLINQLLVELDGFKENKDLLVIAATNSPWEIDPAFRRAGRFTRQVLISPPDRETREEIFRIHTRDKPLDEELALSDLADITRGYSSADIKEICELAAEIPWDEALFGGEVRDIKTEDFLEAIEKQDPSILPWLSSALESLKDSKEEKLYHEMYDMIEAFFNEDKAIEPEVVYPEEEEDELSRELRELEEKIRVAEEKYKEGVIGREDYDLLMGHYRKKLAEMEGRLHEKPLGEPGSFLGISPGDDGMVWMKDMEWTVGTHPSGKLHYRIRSMRGDVFRD